MNREITIFEKIINREIPANIVYEDDRIIAFLDIAPVHAGHTLVVPKNWSRNILDIGNTDRDHLFKAVQKIAKAVQASTNATGINIIMNNEPGAGQIVFHSHVHVIPRHDGDGLQHWPKDADYNQSTSAELATKISAHLKS